jgi:hypothetical protein
VLVIGSGINDIDVTGEERLRDVIDNFRDSGVEIYFSSLKAQIYETLALRQAVPDVLAETTSSAPRTVVDLDPKVVVALVELAVEVAEDDEGPVGLRLGVDPLLQDAALADQRLALVALDATVQPVVGAAGFQVDGHQLQRLTRAALGLQPDPRAPAATVHAERPKAPLHPVVDALPGRASRSMAKPVRWAVRRWPSMPRQVVRGRSRAEPTRPGRSVRGRTPAPGPRRSAPPARRRCAFMRSATARRRR